MYTSPTHAKAVTVPTTFTYDQGVRLFVGGAGDLKVLPAIGASAVTFIAISAGCFVPLYVKAVLSGTSATNIVALW